MTWNVKQENKLLYKKLNTTPKNKNICKLIPFHFILRLGLLGSYHYLECERKSDITLKPYSNL